MALFRQIYQTFWEDTYIEECSPEHKLIFLFLLTNSQTKACGVYEISITKIFQQTGLSIDRVKELINQLVKDKKIKYNTENKEVFIVNWLKYQTFLKSSKAASVIDKELLEIKTSEFKSEVVMACQKLGYPIKFINNEQETDTVSIPYAYPMDTVSIPYGYTNTNTKTNTKTNTNTNSSSNSISINNNNTGNEFSTAPADFGLAHQDLPEVTKFCWSEFNIHPTPTQLSEFDKYLDLMGLNLVLESLKRASLGNKGIRYAIGILKNWRARGILTLQQAEQEQIEFEKKNKIKSSVKVIEMTQEEKDALNYKANPEEDAQANAEWQAMLEDSDY